MPCRAPRAGAVFAAFVFGSLVATAPSFAGDYAIQQGDTIEIAVAGLPELRNKSNVQPDGAISFPLLGALKVEGMTPAELRLQVQKQLAGKIYRYHAATGHDALTVIEAGEVSAEIVGYRPIYVTGAVGHSGEQAFRPQMTVRQAVALAGGVETPSNRAGGYVRDYQVVKSEYDLQRLDGASAAIRAARISAQLKMSAQLPAVDLSGYDLPRAQTDSLLAKEAEILSAAVTDYQREDAFLKSAVAQASDRIDVVEKQRDQEQEGSRADSEELQRIVKLLNKGQETNPRVTDARRALLLSSTRALQVNVELLELQRQKAESERNLQHFELDSRLAWLKELEAANTARTTADAKTQALVAELYDASKGRSSDATKEPVKTSLEVYRQEGARVSKLAVDNDFELKPGDTIEVTLLAPSQTVSENASP